MLHVLVCAGCLGPRAAAAAAELRRALAAAGQGGEIRVALAPCLGPCGSPVALALRAAGGATYVFAGVRLPRDAADVAATCRACLAAPGGWIEDARPCGRLRHCLRVRLPPGLDG